MWANPSLWYQHTAPLLFVNPYYTCSLSFTKTHMCTESIDILHTMGNHTNKYIFSICCQGFCLFVSRWYYRNMPLKFTSLHISPSYGKYVHSYTPHRSLYLHIFTRAYCTSTTKPSYTWNRNLFNLESKNINKNNIDWKVFSSNLIMPYNEGSFKVVGDISQILMAHKELKTLKYSGWTLI